MALSKEVATGYGVSAGYWKIRRVAIEIGATSNVSVEICLYLSRPADTSDNIQPMAAKHFSFPLSSFHLDHISVVKEVYAKVKTAQVAHPIGGGGEHFFSDATDILEEGQEAFDYEAFLASLEE